MQHSSALQYDLTKPRQCDHEEDILRLVGDVMELLSSIIRQYCITMDFKFNSEKDVEYAVEMVNINYTSKSAAFIEAM